MLIIFFLLLKEMENPKGRSHGIGCKPKHCNSDDKLATKSMSLILAVLSEHNYCSLPSCGFSGKIAFCECALHECKLIESDEGITTDVADENYVIIGNMIKNMMNTRKLVT